MAEKSRIKLEFERAVQFINNYAEPIPPDTLLKLYAYYKKGNNQGGGPGRKGIPLINAFKTNALIQTQDLSEEEAMKNYIELAKTMGMPEMD